MPNSLIHRIPSKYRPYLLAALGIFCALLFAKQLQQWFANNSPQPESKIVQIITVKEAEMPSVIETVGSLTSPKEVTIKAMVASKINKILVESGNFVKAGTELVSLVGGAEVRAPFDGYLDDWQVKAGDYINAGEKLVHFVNSDLLSITYRVPEHYGPLLDLGQTVQIAVRAFPNKEFSGKVSFVSPVVDKKTGSILVRAEIDNQDQNLWSGMSARARHILEIKPKALVVPESTLSLDMEGYTLLVAAGGVLKKQAVTVGERIKGRAHILSGVTLGDAVVITKTYELREGVPVKTEEWKGDW